jgi:hypothetical protein
MREGRPGSEGPIMKMKAIFRVEFEAEDGPNANFFLERALDRASMALKDSIEQGAPGADARTGIRQNSTSITVTSQVE